MSGKHSEVIAHLASASLSLQTARAGAETVKVDVLWWETEGKRGGRVGEQGILSNKTSLNVLQKTRVSLFSLVPPCASESDGPLTRRVRGFLLCSGGRRG